MLNIVIRIGQYTVVLREIQCFGLQFTTFSRRAENMVIWLYRNGLAISLHRVKFVKNVEIFCISNKTVIEFSFRKMLRMRQISEAVFFFIPTSAF